MTAPTDPLIERLENVADDMDEIAQAIVDTATKAGAAGSFANRSVRNEDSTVVREAAALIKSAEKVIEPFATWAADNIDEHGWGGNRCERERIIDWFGPSDFRAAAQWQAGQEGEG